MGVLSGGATVDMVAERTETAVPALAPAVPTVSEGRQTRGRSNVPGQLVAYGVVLLVCFISLFPLYWMIINSFRQDANITAGVSLWPDGGVFHLSNYSTAWTAVGYPFQLYLLNSFVLAVAVVIGTVLSCTAVAYGFARFRFPGRELLFAIVISTMMIPYVVTLIPQYAEFINIFGWGSGGQFLIWDNFFQFFPQIVPAFFGSPVWIFLLRQFIRSIPFDLDEAAKIDGAGPMRILWKIIVPEIRPALAAVIVLNFIGKWNDLLGPLIYLKDPKNATIELALLGYESRYSTGTNWGELMAMSLVAMTPILIVYFFASKQIIQGVTLSGVKG
jgi:multiple sugar transport system permease protein